MPVSSVSPVRAADCWFPGCAVVPQHPLLSVLGVHLPSHADQPTHPLWLHDALPHQSLQDLLLQITFLAPQAAGQSNHLFIGAFSATLVSENYNDAIRIWVPPIVFSV